MLNAQRNPFVCSYGSEHSELLASAASPAHVFSEAVVTTDRDALVSLAVQAGNLHTGSWGLPGWGGFPLNIEVCIRATRVL